ncbi:MAG: carbohydrate-binding family 9-like protein [Candidatus Cryptobacteroides sp.]
MKIGKQISKHSLSVCPWPKDFPASPQVSFKIAHNSNSIYLEFSVEEDYSRAQAFDAGRVWEDSCVEFFCSPNPEDGIYYNFECNCIGSLLLCAGKGRHERLAAPQAVLNSVQRFSTLEQKCFESTHIDIWKMVLIIPKEAFFLHNLESLDGMHMRGNFYKCGDLLPQPHFLSYAPINTPKPDFHRPEFFCNLDFE